MTELRRRLRPEATVADIGKLHRHLGWKPVTGLDDGLAQQIEWQRELLG